ncbi:MAG TPA: hypothetical protein VMD98_05130 [Bryocella sp.]|nr:hypothetical protein [Bryocella sp.]
MPGYNSPQRMTSYNRLLLAVLALSLFASARAVNGPPQAPPQAEASGDRWQPPSADLAKQIVAITGPGTITLSIANRSSISSDDVPLIRRALARELRSAGVVVRDGNADSDVRVTLSENLQGWLWVAEVQEGSETKVAMLAVPGASVEHGADSSPAITLRASLVYAQADPILDIALLGTGNGQHLIVLEPEHLRAYTPSGATWQLTQSYDIAHTQPWPRDLRGRIVAANDHLFDAYLPGMSCLANKTGESWTMTVSCTASDDPWPLASQKAFYNSARNFFTGALVPGFGPKLPAFYSAAELERASGTAFVFGDVNGATHILEDGSHKLLLGARDWGSDFVAVRSGCGSGGQVLASAAGWPQSDSVRAYEIAGREATPVSAPLNFDGTITAMWPADDSMSAIVIVQNSQESRYEAYRVSPACSH